MDSRAQGRAKTREIARESKMRRSGCVLSGGSWRAVGDTHERRGQDGPTGAGEGECDATHRRRRSITNSRTPGRSGRPHSRPSDPCRRTPACRACVHQRRMSARHALRSRVLLRLGERTERLRVAGGIGAGVDGRRRLARLVDDVANHLDRLARIVLGEDGADLHASARLSDPARTM